MVILGDEMETGEDCVMRDVNICILCRIFDNESRFIEIRWHTWQRSAYQLLIGISGGRRHFGRARCI
jgi:hypothetical protein